MAMADPDQESILFTSDSGNWAANSTASSSTDMPTLGSMLGTMMEFTKKRDDTDVALFKALLQSGISIFPRADIHGRYMAMHVPEEMRPLVERARRELVAELKDSVLPHPLGLNFAW